MMSEKENDRIQDLIDTELQRKSQVVQQRIEEDIASYISHVRQLIQTLEDQPSTPETNKRLDGIINASEYGDVGTGADDTAALQRMINDAIQNGYQQCLLPAKVLKVTDTILLPESFEKPVITGRGFKSTIIDFSEMPSGKAVFKVKGGSGQFSGGVIEHIGFRGNVNAVAIEAADVCGFHIKHCRFDQCLNGILFHNESGFTEYVIAENCDFSETCERPLEYRQTNGVRSFHGSGMRDCTINKRPGAIEPVVKIGPGCFPYHSPISCQVWTRSAAPIIKNEGENISNFYGTVMIEVMNPDQYQAFDLGDSANNRFYILGDYLVHDHNRHAKIGKAVFCERLQLNNDGSATVQRKPYVVEEPLSTGGTPILRLDHNIVAIVNFIVFANNYEYSYTLNVYNGPYRDEAAVTILARNREFNNAGYGAPSFTISNGQLVVQNSNYPANGVNCYATVQEIGGRFQYRLTE